MIVAQHFSAENEHKIHMRPTGTIDAFGSPEAWPTSGARDRSSLRDGHTKKRQPHTEVPGYYRNIPPGQHSTSPLRW